MDDKEPPEKMADDGFSRHRNSFGFYTSEFLCSPSIRQAGSCPIRNAHVFISGIQYSNLFSRLVCKLAYL